MQTSLNTILLYAKNMQATAEFYQKYFGFISTGEVVEGLIELKSQNGGANILIHQAAKSIKLGQVGVKLMFDVEDIEKIKEESAAQGLKFGATHQANGYSFANTKDPDKNSVAISSRAYRKKYLTKS
ncbi:MAG: VOC family protein [Anaerolineae bacterium]|nr:VOC family protein [Anaerolineae bacterium]